MLLVSNLSLFLMSSLVGVVWGASVSPSASQPTVTKTRVLYVEVEDDYDERTSEPPLKPGVPRLTTAQFPPQECEYDPCVVPKVPCAVLSAQTKCYCPGLTGPDQLPEPPELRELRQGESGAVEVHWCAPLSTVTHYKLMTEDGHGLGSVFGELSRNGTLHGLKAGSRVCVVAVNDAGFSVETEKSCSRFEPQEPSQAALRAGVIAGCVGFLVLLLLAALLLWKRRSCRKSATMDGEGLRNPSYSNSGTL